jgi:L-threonylcarbamoyladenylate synthase
MRPWEESEKTGVAESEFDAAGTGQETVYGLGADALNPEAVDRIFAAKERPSCDPIIVHIARFEDLCMVARDLPPQIYVLSQHFWPGTLTLVLPRVEMLSARVTAGLDTVAVRVPPTRWPWP